MRKYLKYDAKSNMKFFISTFVCFLILLVSLLSIKTVGSFAKFIEIGHAINSLEIILVGVFTMTMFYFIMNTFYKDLYTNRSILTFSLPISARDFLTAKLIVINIFFYLLIFLSVFLFYLMGSAMDVKDLISIIFVMILLNLISLLIFLAMQLDRFIFKRRNAILISVFILCLILIVGFFLNQNFLLLHSGKILRKDVNYLAFLFSYINIEGISYINLTSFIYYIVVDVILYLLNIKILKNDLDLS